jgi:hypothetical protein
MSYVTVVFEKQGLFRKQQHLSSAAVKRVLMRSLDPKREEVTGR